MAWRPREQRLVSRSDKVAPMGRMRGSRDSILACAWSGFGRRCAAHERKCERGHIRQCRVPYSDPGEESSAQSISSFNEGETEGLPSAFSASCSKDRGLPPGASATRSADGVAVDADGDRPRVLSIGDQAGVRHRPASFRRSFKAVPTSVVSSPSSKRGSTSPMKKGGEV